VENHQLKSLIVIPTRPSRARTTLRKDETLFPPERRGHDHEDWTALPLSEPGLPLRDCGEKEFDRIKLKSKMLLWGGNEKNHTRSLSCAN
jgi:hypothetical protein